MKYLFYHCENPVFFHMNYKRIHLKNTEIAPSIYM